MEKIIILNIVLTVVNGVFASISYKNKQYKSARISLFAAIFCGTVTAMYLVATL